MAEDFTNPMAPDHYEDGVNKEQPLTNADFRKFLTAPRERSDTKSQEEKKEKLSTSDYNPEQHESAAEKRRKKKTMYAKLKKQEMERQAELSKKYRDRARERRDGKSDYADSELISTTANYKTVGPSMEADRSSAEKRRQVIQESKYLGGDMAHTHLVKGLDYALLQKVRAEISTKEKEDEELDKALLVEDIPEKPQQAETVTFKTKMAKNIHRLVFQPHKKLRNELFLPGRMAYIFEVDNEYADSDIPTTLLRSKADCPTMESETTLSTNDIVINKLTQILSYLRQGMRDRHKRKKDRKQRGEEKSHKRPVEADLSIFDDAGDYVPSLKKSKRKSSKSFGSYFEKPKVEEEDFAESRKNVAASVNTFVKSVNEKYGDASDDAPKPKQGKNVNSKGISLIGTGESAPDSYMECYPSMQYTLSGIADDSDDEVDYSKMDQGNKKGPVGRWDFDTAEEYSSYMSQKEALPKAAFQYGIKMGGGRKTRRTKEQNEKQKLNRELQQINQIIEKRKGSDVKY